MYYSNDSQGTLSIIYVDFLIMASSRYLVLISCLKPQKFRSMFLLFQSRFLPAIPLSRALLMKHTQPIFWIKVTAVMKLGQHDKSSAIKSNVENYLGSVADDWEFYISCLSDYCRVVVPLICSNGTKTPRWCALHWSHCEFYEWNDVITTFWQ